MTDMTWTSGGDRGRAFWRGFWRGFESPGVFFSAPPSYKAREVDPREAWAHMANFLAQATTRVISEAGIEKK